MLTVAYEFFVEGVPVSQGSMSVFNGRIVHQKGPKLMAWRNAISNVCGGMMEPLTGSVEVEILFVMPHVKSVKRDKPHVRPDLDKLVRAVFDGMTGPAFADDAQVTKLVAEKVYGNKPGAMIIVRGSK